MAETNDRPAFYALASGGWRDYWTLLHPPYTLWHLSYVAIGASLAPELHVRWLLETLLAFLLAIGLAAHALDELHGRPLRTGIPDGVLRVMAFVSLAGAVGLGIDAFFEVSRWIVVFIAIGGFLVVAYNLELFGGTFHSDRWFAVAWGGFPAITGSFAQTGRITVAAVLVAAGCMALSAAQRQLSTVVRRVRRHVADVRGEIVLDDGTKASLGAADLREAPEAALMLLSVAMPLLAAGLVLSRIAI
jgi:hypothetical protein